MFQKLSGARERTRSLIEEMLDFSRTLGLAMLAGLSAAAAFLVFRSQRREDDRQEKREEKKFWSDWKRSTKLKSNSTLCFCYLMVFTKNEPFLQDGPIFVSVSPVEGEYTMLTLKRKLIKWKKQMLNDPATRVLVITGSHGELDGRTALTDLSLAVPQFYHRDCWRVGLQWENDGRPVEINAEREKLTLQESIVNLDSFNKMKFQVLNLPWYHNNEQKLIKDNKAFNPTKSASPSASQSGPTSCPRCGRAACRRSW